MKEAALVSLDTSPVALESAPGRRLVRAFFSGRNARTLEAYRQDLETFRAFVGADSLDEAAGLLLSHGHGEANALGLTYRAKETGRRHHRRRRVDLKVQTREKQSVASLR